MTVRVAEEPEPASASKLPPPREVDAAKVTANLSVGPDFTVGRYILTEPLGRGGSATVFKARHATLGNHVAVKLLRACPDEPAYIERFAREAKLAALLSDLTPRVVTVFDYGTVTDSRGEEIPFLVLELLRGETLAERLLREPRLALPHAASVLGQLAEGLSVVHRNGIVHRDLKPTNVFLCSDRADGDELKLVDFGIAIAAGQSSLTRTGAFVGTPGYASPEQISQREAVDLRADLWAASVIAYEMLSGEHPFGKGTLDEVLGRVLWQPVLPPSQVNSNLPQSFDRFMARALSRSAGERFATSEAWRQALEEALGTAPTCETLALHSPLPFEPSGATAADIPTEEYQLSIGPPSTKSRALDECADDAPGNSTARHPRTRWQAPLVGLLLTAIALVGARLVVSSPSLPASEAKQHPAPSTQSADRKNPASEPDAPSQRETTTAHRASSTATTTPESAVAPRSAAPVANSPPPASRSPAPRAPVPFPRPSTVRAQRTNPPGPEPTSKPHAAGSSFWDRASF